MQDLPLGALPAPEEPLRSGLDVWNEALAFWEPRRLLFNGALLLVTVCVLASSSQAPRLGSLQLWCELVVCAGGANLCYCAAYPAEFLLFVTSRSPRLWRHLLFLGGLGLSLMTSLAVLEALLTR